MDELRSVLVAVDFSDLCKPAVERAILIGRWNQCPVRAVHVIDTLVAIDMETALSGLQRNIHDSLVSDAKRAWTSFAGGIDGASGLSIDVRIDNRVRGILAAARESGADLLVLGARGEGEVDVGPGTVATGCVRHAMCRVMLVREKTTGPFRRVVACVDFSPTSLLALDQAARIAIQDSAELHVLHVFTPPWRALHYRAPTLEAAPQFQRQYRDALERRLRTFAGELGREIEFLKPVFTLFEHEGHRSGIVQYAADVGADLIVLGARGRTNLRDVFLGSTAEKALRESTCSVLVVKPEGFTSTLAAGEDPPTTQIQAAF